MSEDFEGDVEELREMLGNPDPANRLFQMIRVNIEKNYLNHGASLEEASLNAEAVVGSLCEVIGDLGEDTAIDDPAHTDRFETALQAHLEVGLGVRAFDEALLVDGLESSTKIITGDIWPKPGPNGGKDEPGV